MKKTFFIAVLLFGPLIWGMVSVEEAARIIKECEGVADMPLSYEGLTSEASWAEWGTLPLPPASWPFYFFTSDYTTHTEYFKDPKDALGRYYAVDPFTGQIVMWLDNTLDFLYPIGTDSVEEELEGELKEEVKYVPQVGNVSDMLTPEQLVNKAINYVKKFYPAFDPSQYAIEISHIEQTPSGGFLSGERPYNPPGSSWHPNEVFQFRKTIYFTHKVVDGVGDTIYDFTSYFWVDLTSTGGELISFHGYHYPISISLVPTISREEAEQIAFNYISNWEISHGFPPPSYAEVTRAWKGVQLLPGAVPPDCHVFTWAFEIYVEIPGERFPRSGYIEIDAHTGEVYKLVWDYGFPKERLPTIKQLKYYKKALRAKREAPKSWKMVIKPSRGSEEVLYRVLLKDGRFYIEAGQALCFSVLVEDNKKDVILKYRKQELKLSANDIFRKGGNLYIALEPVLRLAGYKADYVKEEKEIRIERKS